MNKIKNSKALRIAVSVLVALIIWLYVENIDPSIVTLDVWSVPVEFVGEEDVLADRGLMVSSEKDAVINLTLQGQRNVISDLGRGKGIKVQVDLTSITATGQHRLDYDIVYPDSINEKNIELVDASAYKITVDVVELYKKSIEIQGERIGSPADGYMAGSMTFGEDTILVSGEQLAVSNISHALVNVDLSGADETIHTAAEFQLIDYNGNVLDKEDFRISVDTVQITVPILMIKELDLTVDYVESAGSMLKDTASSITPPKITVAGDSSSISKLEEITIAKVVLSELTRDTSFTVPIPIPAGAVNLSGETEAVVTIGFMNLESRTFTSSNVSFINEPEGKDVSVVTNEVDVVLRGPAEELDKIEGYNIRVVGDMTDITASNGNYAIPATVYVDGNNEVGAIGTYQITVRISS